MAESSYDEFLSDFGDGLNEQELARLLADSRATNDREVRLLVKQYRTLRQSCRALIKAIEVTSTVDELRNHPIVRDARFLVGELRSTS